MTIKVLKQITVMGKTFPAPHYLPQEVPPTRTEREKADSLDIIFRMKISEINNEYEKLKKTFSQEIDKWRWLGGNLDKIISMTKNLDKKDIDNNSIWFAFNQYLHTELKRDSDQKRTGTAKDHLRKCWLLYKSKGTKWIKNWAGWDALVDRGDQLATDERLLLALEKVFIKHIEILDSRDYQKIFKLVTDKIPSGSGRKDLLLIKSSDLDKIASDIEKEWIKLERQDD